MVNQTSNKESSPAAFLVIALFILMPPLGILAAVAMAVYSRRKKSVETGGGQTRPTRSTPVSDRLTGRPKVTHGHTPQTYSYDGCAVEKRLEQLDTLKKAGLMENDEYLRFRQKLLKEA